MTRGSLQDDDQDCTNRRGASRPRGTGTVLLALTLLVVTGCAPDPPPERTGETGPAARPSFTLRLDSESSTLADFQLVEDDDGYRIKTGPAGIAYRPDDAILTGDLLAQATFRQFDAPLGYREAYGIFVGGIDLEGADLEYTYLLIRPTGDVLIKRRIGEVTETLLDWTPHPSVRQVQAEGDEPVNTLSIDVFDGETHFVVNGDIVHAESASRVRPYGVAGVRVNHRLDVRVDEWILRETSSQS